MDHLLFLDVLSVMIVSITIIPLLDITLNIRYMIWSVYVCWLSTCSRATVMTRFMFYKYFVQKEKEKERVVTYWEVFLIWWWGAF